MAYKGLQITVASIVSVSAFLTGAFVTNAMSDDPLVTDLGSVDYTVVGVGNNDEIYTFEAPELGIKKCTYMPLVDLDCEFLSVSSPEPAVSVGAEHESSYKTFTVDDHSFKLLEHSDADVGLCVVISRVAHECHSLEGQAPAAPANAL